MGQDKILSIRLSPGGLSFWTAGAAEEELAFDPAKGRSESLREGIRAAMETLGAGCRLAEVCPDTLRTVVVPGEYASADALAQLLKANNITPGEADEVVYAGVSSGIKAAVVCDRAELDVLREAASAANGADAGHDDAIGILPFAIVSPFSMNGACLIKHGAGRRRSAAVYLTPAHAYITVFEKKSGAWLYADVMKWSAATDILYYMSVLDQQFGLRKGKLYLRGPRACEAGELLRKYFRKTRCE